MSDCIQHYRLYKKACTDDIDILSATNVSVLNEVDSQALYRTILRKWYAKICGANCFFRALIYIAIFARSQATANICLVISSHELSVSKATLARCAITMVQHVINYLSIESTENEIRKNSEFENKKYDDEHACALCDTVLHTYCDRCCR